MENKTAFIAVGVAVLIAVVLITASITEHAKLMDECLADGKKRYECIGILKSNTVIVR